MSNSEPDSTASNEVPVQGESAEVVAATEAPVEIGGRDGLDPVRYGDWEKNGRCIDF